LWYRESDGAIGMVGERYREWRINEKGRVMERGNGRVGE